jgi:nickel-type superoxide dismutase maturation protease
MPLAKGGALLRAAFVVLFAVATWALLLRQRMLRFEVSGESMAPALRHGDYVAVDRFAYRSHGPHVGDVVVIPDPRVPARQLLKRVVRHDPELGLWVQGDNTSESTDSRTFGWVSPSDVIGRVAFRYWPAPRWFR